MHQTYYLHCPYNISTKKYNLKPEYQKTDKKHIKLDHFKSYFSNKSSKIRTRKISSSKQMSYCLKTYLNCTVNTTGTGGSNIDVDFGKKNDI